MTVLTLDNQKKFIRSLDENSDRVLYLFALGTGLLRGELLALKWSNIDLNNLLLSVEKSISQISVVDKNGKRNYETIEQIPKSLNSIIKVPIPENLIAILKE